MPQKVIYVTGAGHSGSTLLDLLISSHSRVESVGEVTAKSLRRQFRGSTAQCTCGKQFGECEFWTNVKERLRVSGIKDSKDILAPIGPSATEAFISSVLAVSGRSVYAESTKRPDRLRTLLETPALDVFVLHIVRDPRAVALSWRNKNGRFIKAARMWSSVNAEIEKTMRDRPTRLLRVHYEDLAFNPQSELVRIMRFCEENFEQDQLNFSAREHHNLAGNRMRLSATHVEPDTRYLRELNTLHWHTLNAITNRALWHYGYSLSRATMRHRLSV